MKGRVTSHDIAREAGVARSTVSLVLTNNPKIQIPEATRKRIDGLIIINPRKGDAGLVKVIESKFPVLVFGSSGHPQEHAVGTQDGKASCRVTEHLVALGHKRIAHISYAPWSTCPHVNGLKAIVLR